MTQWTSRSRFEAVLAGEVPDRPPVAAWGHFFGVETDPEKLAAATVQFTKTYDWDWVKINPRNTYYLEAFGNTYDYSDYHGTQPYQKHAIINSVEDLGNVDHQRALGSQPFVDQLNVLSRVKEALPDLPVAQTVFSPLTILLGLAGLPRKAGKAIPGSKARNTFRDFVEQDADGTRRALDEITVVLEDYIANIARSGAEAVYYALTGTANPAITGDEIFNDFSTPYDRRIIATAKDNGLSVIFHTCGVHAFPEILYSYPVDAISWDHFDPGNPPIGTDFGEPAVAGVNRAEVTRRDADLVKDQAQQAIRAYANKPFLLAPTCSTVTELDNPALFALRSAVGE